MMPILRIFSIIKSHLHDNYGKRFQKKQKSRAGERLATPSEFHPIPAARRGGGHPQPLEITEVDAAKGGNDPGPPRMEQIPHWRRQVAARYWIYHYSVMELMRKE